MIKTFKIIMSCRFEGTREAFSEVKDSIQSGSGYGHIEDEISESLSDIDGLEDIDIGRPIVK